MLTGANIQIENAMQTSPEFRDGYFTCWKLNELTQVPGGHLIPEVANQYDYYLGQAMEKSGNDEFRAGYLAGVRVIMQPEFEHLGPEHYRTNGGY